MAAHGYARCPAVGKRAASSPAKAVPVPISQAWTVRLPCQRSSAPPP